jgi:hypothetical protein
MDDLSVQVREHRDPLRIDSAQVTLRCFEKNVSERTKVM